MMKKTLILVIFFVVIVVRADSSTCSCEQILSKNDCESMPVQNCEWTSSKCQVSNIPKTPTINNKQYCSQFKNSNDCRTRRLCKGCITRSAQCDTCTEPFYPCVWLDGVCQYFTGCTSFNLKESVYNSANCQAQSLNCVTDTQLCIQKGLCSDYKSALACKQRDIFNRICTYDNFLGCKNTATCDDIPADITTHDDCNDTLSTCTAKLNGGCQLLSENCGNYTYEKACRLTTKGTKCYWTSDGCQEMKCSFAQTSLSTVLECSKFMETCTSKPGGGCQERITCDKKTSPQDCAISDTDGNECFWISNNKSCVIHKCEYAPTDYQTNGQCKSFKEECIVNTNGNGCSLNKGCSAISTKSQCDGNKSAEGSDCFWSYESICIEKTCENAQNKVTTHSDCEIFLFECTTNAGMGCVQKTCKNAPDSIQSNEDCEKYLPNNNCITISGGGCTKNDSCSKAGIQKACVKDINGYECFWNEITSECQTKQCEKAPTKYNTQELCSQFMSACQINQSQTGCEVKSCENFVQQGKCDGQSDYKGVQCSWQNICIEKKCEYASQENETFDDCQDFLPSCTLSNTGKGCMPLPLRCDVITKQDGCFLRVSIPLSGVPTTKQCAWKSGKCLDKSCDTAPSTLDSNLKCKQYLDGCYVNNNRQGCWQLPECTKRKLSDICQIENNYDCVWDQDNGLCLNRTCQTATAKTVDFIQNISFYTCNNYAINISGCPKKDGRGCCTVNEAGTSCIVKPDSCSQLKNEKQCQFNAIISGGDCLWTGTVCAEKSCAALKLEQYSLTYTHANCFVKSNETCTVSGDQKSCIDLKSNCSEYKLEDQCRIDKFSNECVLRLNQKTNTFSCDQKQCSDVYSSEYSDFSDCQQYKETCTVIARVKNTGCIDRFENCFDYKFENQCVKTLSGQSCKWNGDRCWDSDKIECAKIFLTNFSTPNCESVAWYCKSNINNAQCELKKCSDLSTIDGLTSHTSISTVDHCAAFVNINSLFNCQINSSLNQCVESKDYCYQYTSTTDCYYAKIDKQCQYVNGNCYKITAQCLTWSAENDSGCKQFRQFCKYPDGQTGKVGCQDGNCSDKIGSGLNHQSCQQFDTSCTATVDGSKCMLIQSDCGSYKAPNDCTQLQSFKCIWVNQQCIGVLSAKDAETNCSLKAGTSLDECQSFSKYCSINRSKNSCIKIQQCSIYTISNCLYGSDGVCVQSKEQDSEAVCLPKANVTCSNIYLGQSTTYTYDVCNSINSKCTNLNSTGCQDKTCDNKTQAPFSHSSCSEWNPSCTVNKDNNKCVDMKAFCKDQTSNSCLRTSSDGECDVDKTSNLCIKKTCYTNLTATTDNECGLYLSSCTVAFAGGCMNRTECKNYKTQEQCVEDNLNRICYWNPSDHNCVLFSCDAIEKSTKYDTHDECYALTNVYDPDKLNYTKRCTVKINTDTSTPDGCMDLLPCKSYQHQEQCYQANDGTYCNWNTDNSENQFCEERTCRSAPDSFTSHKQCAEFKMNVSTKYQDKCTVANNENLQPVGCMDRGSCENYKLEDQCHFNANGTACKWDSLEAKCFTKVCGSAPVSFTTHERCYDFSSECTVNFDLKGCTQIVPVCENYQVKEQCVKSSVNKLCNWDGVKCVTRACNNTPSDNQTTCQNYLSTCTEVGSNRCKTQSCDDFLFATDKDCRAAGLDGRCTTNGVRCVLRKSCEEALCQQACVTSAELFECIWQPATSTTDAYCYTSVCSQAGRTYSTAEQCRTFSSQCTVKNGGGCKRISDCTSFETENSCSKSIDGKNCGWKNGKCYSNDCTDLKGTDHFVCYNQNQRCTVSNNGQCIYKLATCDQYNISQSCVEAEDGTPCLWISGNSTAGKCIAYTGCKDIPFGTDAECKAISQQCTTNGANCIPLEKCENLSSVGCVTGTFGNCMLIAKEQNSAVLTCSLFQQCSDAIYTTHAECQKVSLQCTSNGQICINLQSSCSAYSSNISCQQTNSFKSCVWTGTTCRDVQCEDIFGSTNDYCSKKLSSCSSNGSKCITKKSCVSYQDSTSCTYGQGLDGTCIWGSIEVLTGNLCRLKQCTDVLIPTKDNCKSVNSCVFDGTKCVQGQSDCSKYTSTTSCVQGTTDSKACFWNSSTNTCSRLNSCSELGSDKTSCDNLAGCLYVEKDGVGKCFDPTCELLYQEKKSCQYFKTLTNDLKACSQINNACSEFSPMQQDASSCFSSSQYTYTWSTSSSACVKCAINNTSGGDSNSTDNSTDDWQSILYGLLPLSLVMLN